ncbi:MAG: family N-acetyltransferase [Symbiobacteriaceae bacterium]|jgi:GNAT superfamily N-acetyltransferase|nr:family N-acetyltransferase [Symbiobacteriaceae bacterium]
MPDEILARLSYERREAMWRRVLEQPSETGVFVAEDEAGEVVAFVSGGAERSGDSEYKGELQGLYALKRVHGQGVGRALVGAMVGWLVERGFDSMLLWVLDTNPTRRFYEHLGGVACREKTEQLGDAVLREIGYGWKELGRLASGDESY